MSSQPGADPIVVSVREQMMKCLQPWMKTLDAEMTFIVALHLNRDGTLSKPPELTNKTKLSDEDEHHNELANKLLLTIQKCPPLKLPPEQYDNWKEIDLHFNAREAPDR